MRTPHINKSDNEIIGNYRRANTTNPEFKQINSREGEFRISDDRISPDAAVPHQVREESHCRQRQLKIQHECSEQIQKQKQKQKQIGMQIQIQIRSIQIGITVANRGV